MGKGTDQIELRDLVKTFNFIMCKIKRVLNRQVVGKGLKNKNNEKAVLIILLKHEGGFDEDVAVEVLKVIRYSLCIDGKINVTF